MGIIDLAGSRITLHDVARLAKVHYATASTVLNGSKGSTTVSEATARRVVEAARELGYKVNRSAQQLRTRRSSVVGLLTGDVENPFFARMVSVCSAALEQAGYDVILASRRHDDFGDYHLLESLLTRDVAGVLVWSEALTEVHERIARSGITEIVVIGRGIPGYDSVAGEMETGIREAFDHLHAEGYSRIGYMTPYRFLSRPGEERDQIYREKMAQFGQPEIVIDFESTASDIAAAVAAGEALADQPAGERPDALFCFNDMTAFGVMMGLRRRGLSVPGDIAIVGCDNLDIVSHLDVPLTTIDYPLEAVARAAVRLLLQRIDTTRSAESSGDVHHEILDTHLVVRASTRRRQV